MAARPHPARVRRPRTALLPDLSVRRDVRQFPGISRLRAVPRPARQPLGRAGQLPAVARRRGLLARDPQHGRDSAAAAGLLLPGAAGAGDAAAQRHACADQTVRAERGLPAPLHLVGDRRGAVPPDARRDRRTQWSARRLRPAHRAHPGQPGRVQTDAGRPGHLEGHRLGHHHLPRRPHPGRRAALRGVRNGRSGAVAALLARDPARDSGGHRAAAPCRSAWST